MGKIPSRLVNLTPHPVDLIGVDGSRITIPVEGIAPRVLLERSDVDEVDVDGVTITICESRVVSAPDDLPDPVPGVLLIVSRMVAEHTAGRDDLVFPDDLVRDESGAVTGCRRLGRTVRK